MTGFTNFDGSALIGAVNPAGNGQALKVDGSGNLMVTSSGGAGSTVNVADPTTPANKIKVNADGSINVNPSSSSSSSAINDGTTTSQKASVDASGNLQVKLGQALPTGSNVIGTVQLADGTTSTQKLAIDSSGRLTLVPNQSINIAQIAGAAPSASNALPTANYIGGSAVSVSNPYPSADQIRLWTQNGQGFSCTTGKQTAAGAITAGFAIFNPNASGKTILIFAIEVMIGNTSFSSLNFVSGSDPAFGTSMTAANRRNGSATSSVASLSYANSNQSTPPGTTNNTICGASNTAIQGLQNGDVIFLNANTGIAFLPNLSAANSWCVSAQWLEI
jgi:hypothetical protein